MALAFRACTKANSIYTLEARFVCSYCPLWVGMRKGCRVTRSKARKRENGV